MPRIANVHTTDPTTMKTAPLTKPLTALALIGASAAAHAHTGHGTSSLMEGLLHPFGPDHLLAMVAVGTWSAAALPARQAWQGPAAFMLALAAGAVLGFAGLTLPFLEHAIALSVVLFGAMLMRSGRTLARPTGLALVAAAAALHGLAHGAETPPTGFAGYAAGFLLTTAALHASGVGLVLGIRRRLAAHGRAIVGGLGALVGGAGLYLFGQL
jgi:urease accessory protein